MKDDNTTPLPAGGTRIAYLFFFLSGATALIYQVVWVRALALVFGNTTHATSTVLAAFMAGLGLGSAFGGLLSSRLGSRSSLRAFAALELCIGVSPQNVAAARKSEHDGVRRNRGKQRCRVKQRVGPCEISCDIGANLWDELAVWSNDAKRYATGMHRYSGGGQSVEF